MYLYWLKITLFQEKYNTYQLKYTSNNRYKYNEN